VSRIDDLVKQLCPSGVAFKPIGDVGIFIRGNGLQKSDLSYSGIPAIHYGQIHTHYGTWATDTVSFVVPESAQNLRKAAPGDLVIATTSEDDEGVAKAVAWVGASEAAVSGDAYIYRHTLVPKYASYFFQSDHFQRQKRRAITGTKVRRISGEGLARISVPVPPVVVQEEIVRTLDRFQELHVELEAELEARRRQFDHYLRSLLLESRDIHARWGTLGEIGRVAMCKRVYKAETTTAGEIPFYKIGTFGGTPDAFITRELYDNYRRRYSFPRKGDVLISAAGTIGRAIPYDGEPAYFQDSNIVWIDNDEALVTNRFLYYWYQVAEWSTDGGTIQRLYNDNLRRAAILIPSLTEQHRVVSALDKLDALLNGRSASIPAELSARRKQYGYYRDHLLAFDEVVA
jgi:type I restriction enzyme, S subunit